MIWLAGGDGRAAASFCRAGGVGRRDGRTRRINAPSGPSHSCNSRTENVAAFLAQQGSAALHIVCQCRRSILRCTLVGLSACRILGGVTVLFGVAGVGASARLYLVPGRPAWNSPFTMLEFYLHHPCSALRGPTSFAGHPPDADCNGVRGHCNPHYRHFEDHLAGRSGVHELQGVLLAAFWFSRQHPCDTFSSAGRRASCCLLLRAFAWLETLIATRLRWR